MAHVPETIIAESKNSKQINPVDNGMSYYDNGLAFMEFGHLIDNGKGA
jgi:hypothetical protein